MRLSLKLKAVLPVILVLLAGILVFAWISISFEDPERDSVIAVAAAGAVAICAALLVVVTYLVQRPLVELRDKIARLRNGDLSVSVSFAGRHDEIGDLGHDFNDMVRQLRESREEIQRLYRTQMSRAEHLATLGELAAGLAHEIKNPLAGIRGAAQLLEPGLSSEDKTLTRLICAETDRIRDLVDQMEVFSDDRPVERKPVNIHIVLERVKHLAVAGIAGGVVIREEYDPSLPPVSGNHDQLVQVFLNLVKNAAEAVQAAGEGGEIVLTTAFRPGVRLTVQGTGERISLPLEVCVHDTGTGIPDDVKPHIFDPFITTKPGGKGLGLALVAKIIGDHGGVVESEARERGTTFRVLLPMLKGSDGSAAEKDAPTG